MIEREAAAQLMDVRTEVEWAFVGVPDLSPLGRQALFCEWQRHPSAANPDFIQEAMAALSESSYRNGAPLLFLCRSGGRSRAAAIAVTAAGYGPCFNIMDGFEGALDAGKRRGARGWKADGLPWIQS